MLLLYFMRSYLLLRMPQLLKFYLVQYFCIILNILKLELDLMIQTSELCFIVLFHFYFQLFFHFRL